MAVKKDYIKRVYSADLKRVTVYLDGKIVDQLLKLNVNLSVVCRDALEKVLNELKKEK